MKKPSTLFLIGSTSILTLAVGVFFAVNYFSAKHKLLDTVISESTYKPVVVVAVGDIACPADEVIQNTVCESSQVATLVKNLKPNALLLLGDQQYSKGDLKNYEASFDKDWGSLLYSAFPTPGNHEYGTKNASGYFDYFAKHDVITGDRDKGYYKATLSNWTILSLNSNCEFIGGCAADSPQGKWIAEQVKSSETCSLAIWHHPRFTSGKYAKDASSKARSDYFWQELYNNNFDIVLNGHDHIYERFAPQDAFGVVSDKGMREFLVGTGGMSYYSETQQSANSEAVATKVSGVLELSLFKKAYSWRYITIEGKVLDSGTAACK